MPPVKVLVAGDVDGKFDLLFARAQALNAKVGPFDCLLCVGRFLSTTTPHGADNAPSLDYLKGTTPVPIPTYFISANPSEFELPDAGGEICPNLHFLGKQGVLKIHGLHVAFVSGKYDPYVQQAGISTITAYTTISVNEVCAAAMSKEFARCIDILLTAEWPKNVLSTIGKDTAFSGGSPVIAGLAKRLAPRYHFAATEGIFYARVPYKNVDALHSTRFIGLSSINGSTEKHKKWLYALNINPMSNDPTLCIQVTEDTTPNPFIIDLKTAPDKRPRQGDPLQVSENGISGRWSQAEDSASKRRREEDCWFCIKNVKSDARHLIVSYGEFVYLALPRGPIMPGHTLIIPMEHHTASSSLHEGLQTEVAQYTEALAKLYDGWGCYLVMYERNIQAQHMHLQCFPIPNEITQDRVRNAILSRAVKKGMSFGTVTGTEAPDGDFMLFALPDEKLIYHHDSRHKFEMQFGREVLCDIIGQPSRADWKNANQSVVQEQAAADKFKSDFKPYDWTTELARVGKPEKS
eukprot:TRINITY_DN16915_c0_g1_i1.p1 TRINITY_DN16915_c0_g1~~TRINITY_DN16915_c0_g1_i1.p1  ORF type:complete len:527 (+),score=65.35 TRINITY_DN16915_c0_g1_i1:22-1581(+)